MEYADSNSSRSHFPLIHLSLVELLLLSIPLWLQAKIDTTGNRATLMPKVTGQLIATTEFYHTSDSPSRYAPLSWAAYGNLALTAGRWTIPVSFILSEKERSDRQPFNQVGLSPQWKWLTLHAGYRNIYFSSFTLAGLTLLGGGAEALPGKLRLGAVYGRLQCAVATDTTDGHGVFPAFERWGYAIKAGVGNARNFLDLIFLHARDKEGPALAYGSNLVTPAENDVGGLITKYALLKNLLFEAEASLSLYTRDIRDSGSNSGLPSLPFTTNHGTQMLSAARAGLTYTAKRWSLISTYRRIEPEYRSMGAWYFQNDVEQVSLSPRVAFPKRNMGLSAAVGVERNNLFNIRATSTRRIIGNFHASWQVTPRYGFDLQYANFGISERNRKAGADSSSVAQVQHLFSCNHRYLILKGTETHSFSGSFLYQRLNYKEASAIGTDSRYWFGTLAYSFGLTEAGLSLNANIGYASSSTGEHRTRTLNVNLGARKSLYDEKIQAGISTNWQPSSRRGSGDGRFFMTNLYASYYATPKHTISLDLSFQSSHDEGSLALLKNAEEWRGILSYHLFL